MAKGKSSASQRQKSKQKREKKRAEAQTHKRRETQAKALRERQRKKDPLFDWDAERDGVDGVAKRLGIDAFEASLLIEPGEFDKTGTCWSMARVRELEDKGIEEKLTHLGLSADDIGALPAPNKETFSTWSWSIENWLPKLGEKPSAADKDFIRIAACVLRARKFADGLAREQIVEPFVEWRLAHHAHDHTAAAKHGTALWAKIAEAIPADVKTGKALEDWLDVDYDFQRWPHDLGHDAGGVALDDPELGHQAAEALFAFVQQMSDEPLEWRLSSRQLAGSAMYDVGQNEQGEEILQAIIEEAPNLGLGYVALALETANAAETAAEIDKSIALLEQAQARPVEDAEQWELSERLEALKEKKAELAG